MSTSGRRSLWGPLVGKAGQSREERPGPGLGEQRPSTGEVQEFFSRAQEADLQQSGLLDTLVGRLASHLHEFGPVLTPY